MRFSCTYTCANMYNVGDLVFFFLFNGKCVSQMNWIKIGVVSSCGCVFERRLSGKLSFSLVLFYILQAVLLAVELTLHVSHNFALVFILFEYLCAISYYDESRPKAV